MKANVLRLKWRLEHGFYMPIKVTFRGERFTGVYNPGYRWQFGWVKEF